MATSTKKFKLPTKFKLLGHEYNVVLVPGLYLDKCEYGEFAPGVKTIRIQPPAIVPALKKVDDRDVATPARITENDVAETFYHEAVHAILDAIGENELYYNEKFVNMMGKALLEIHQTSAYGSKRQKPTR